MVLNSPGLVALLDLDGEVFPMENGFWTKIDAKIVMRNDGIPHGVRYSLTLRNRSNQRVLGYDNAHSPKMGRKGFGNKMTEWDLYMKGVGLNHISFRMQAS